MPQKGLPLMLDHFYQLQYRRLRRRFKMSTITRHEKRVRAALNNIRRLPQVCC